MDCQVIEKHHKKIKKYVEDKSRDSSDNPFLPSVRVSTVGNYQ